jgi:hypothetical protein
LRIFSSPPQIGQRQAFGGTGTVMIGFEQSCSSSSGETNAHV